jgi:methylated-DNA-[protein]-cysteine S-methyltransferase
VAADLIYTTADTPLGPLTIVASSTGIVATGIGEELGRIVADAERRLDGAARRDDRALADARREARSYFAGRLRSFSTPVDLSIARTEFWRRAYEAAIQIPFGEMRTYGDLAAAAGRPRAARAAGHAMRTCPVELWIPCHRVVPAGPGFGTYGGHPERREFLLRLEGAI